MELSPRLRSRSSGLALADDDGGEIADDTEGLRPAFREATEPSKSICLRLGDESARSPRTGELLSKEVREDLVRGNVVCGGLERFDGSGFPAALALDLRPIGGIPVT